MYVIVENPIGEPLEYADGTVRRPGNSWHVAGSAYLYHGMALPTGEHMGALFDRGIREGLAVERQVW